MPELPEIETLRTELAPVLVGSTIRRVHAHRAGLREPFPRAVLNLKNVKILGVGRRSKYLRVQVGGGSILVHLGMSGQLRLIVGRPPRGKHDHLDIELSGGRLLRLRDPRRFGAVFWEPDGAVHPRLADLGPEPLSPRFTSTVLAERLAGHRVPLKAAIMDARIVVGVGNIYATEALFTARLSPWRVAGSLLPAECRRLASAVRTELKKGIASGGSSMRDYVHADGSLGGFLGQAKVYGRAGLPCLRCKTTLISRPLAGRATTWCTHCQR